MKNDKTTIKIHDSKTLLEKEIEKANIMILEKTKELNMIKHDKSVLNSQLKGEEKILEVKIKHISVEIVDKQRKMKS